MNQESLINRLGALALALGEAQERAIRDASGLSASASSAIITLGLYPGFTIGAIARIAGLTHSVAVRVVEALVRDGLITRGPGADRREVALRLTTEGEATRVRILAERRAALGRAIGALGPDERVALDAALSRMLTSLTESRVGADHLCRLCDETACGEDCPVEIEAVRLDGMAS